MDKGVADKLKKRKSDDTDRDEGPLAGPDQGLKRKKTCKEIEPSKKVKSTGTSKGTTKSQPKAIGKSAQAKETVFEAGDTQVAQNIREDTGNTDESPVVKADPKDWFKKPKRPSTSDPECNKGDRYPFDLSKPLPLIQSRNRQIVLVDYFFKNDLACLQGGSTDRTYTTSLTKKKAAKYDLPGIKDMVPNLWNMLLLVVQNRLFNLKGEDIVHLAAALCMFTRRIVIQKRVEDLQLGVESYQKKLNISKLRTHEEDPSQRAPYSYTTLSDPQGVIYEDKLNRKRLMRSDELYKFSDDTL
ncbi:hypothetical protein Tco_1570462 [Tanacetum coccineum]